MSSSSVYSWLDSLSKAQETIALLQEELAATNHEVLQLTLDLEQRVAERTAELSRANDELIREIKERRRAEKEILMLNTSLVQRAKELENINKKLEQAYETMRRDVQAASAMQLRLLPRKLEVPNRALLDWFLLPSSFLAGDMLGYFLADPRHLIFYLLDVAGHGIPAALLSVTVNRLLTPAPGTSLLHMGGEIRNHQAIYFPVEIISELNRRFQSLEENEYFTIVYGVYDLETGEIRFCQAGHPTPFHISNSAQVALAGGGGFPVGLWPEMTYDETTVRLAPGERFVLYSDGISECRSPDGECYGTERLGTFLGSCAKMPLSELIVETQKEVTQWHGQAEFSDDVSFLVIERIE